MIQPVVEKKALLESVENDVDFLKTVIGVFITDCPRMLAEIRLAVAARNPTLVKSAAHALKGSVSFFGATSAVEASRILEFMGREENLDGVDEALGVLEREMALVLFALDEIAMDTA